MGGATAAASAAALALCGLLLLAFAPSQTAAVRIAFVADTGIGNDNPSDYWVDFYGNRQAPVYKVDGRVCLDYEGEPCRLYSRARDVIAGLRDNGAELIVHAGDLDYESSPQMWRHFVDETIRKRGMDYVAVKGNHDVDGWDGVKWLWSGNDGYARHLKPTTPYGCQGTYGEDMVCDYKGVTLVMSSVGVETAGESANQAHYEFLDRKLRESKSRWKICVWHMTMAEMQVSYKGDSTGWGAYEICRKHGAFIVTGHAHTYSRTHEMARFGTKKYGHTKKDLVVNHKDGRLPPRLHLSSGQNGTSAVAVVGIGGYKNEEQLRGGNHWAKIYSSQCLPGDTVCETAPTAAKFGALMCDFNDFSPGAEAECWTVTTVGKTASNAQKRRSYRNPVDRFFLVAGKRPAGSTDGRPEVFINDAVEDEDDVNKSRGLRGEENKSEQEMKNAKRRTMKRSNCTDVPPPPSGGQYYTCLQQKEFGKCDAWFMKNGKLCERTCGRCVDIFEDLTDDYVDYEETEPEEPAEAPAEAPAPGPGAGPDGEMDDEEEGEEPTVPPDATTAPAPAPTEDDDVIGDDDAPAPSPAASPAAAPAASSAGGRGGGRGGGRPGAEEDAATDELDDELMSDVDFDAVADEVLADEAAGGRPGAEEDAATDELDELMSDVDFDAVADEVLADEAAEGRGAPAASGAKTVAAPPARGVRGM